MNKLFTKEVSYTFDYTHIKFIYDYVDPMVYVVISKGDEEVRFSTPLELFLEVWNDSLGNAYLLQRAEDHDDS